MAKLHDLLSQWEENYKRGFLTLWILLILDEGSNYPYQIAQQLGQASHGSMQVEENSVYRALRRYQEAGIVRSEMRPSEVGPDRRYYSLTELGDKLLKEFVERNIIPFLDESVKVRLHKLLTDGIRSNNDE